MREFLQSWNADYEDINVSRGRLQEKKDLGFEFHTYPVVLFKGKDIGGYEDAIVNKELIEYLKKHKRNRD